MRSLSLVISIILLLALVAIGYGVFRTNASDAEVEAQVTEITPASEINPVDANILSRPVVKEVEDFRTFGTQPVQVNPATLNRVNPFDTL